MSEAAKKSGAASQLVGEDFSVAEAIGGWRGLAESIAPGTVYVASFLIWGGYRIPVIASLSTVAVMVAVRLIQRTPVTQALGGVLGVVIGAIWAWRSGDASDYYVPGFWLSAAWGVGLLGSMAVRWPAAGIVVGLLRGWGSRWRAEPTLVRRFQWATGAFAAVFVTRLAVQIPLYLAGATAALGTARLAMGTPLFVLGLWVVWLMVRRLALPEEPADPPRPRG